MDAKEFLLPLGQGIHAVDTGFHRPRFDAAYLMVQNGRALFIDTGTNFGVPRLLAALAHLGLAREAVDWVIPTHVHLDHAGGAGRLLQELPQARALVHPRGLRHLVDPTALYEGALAVYGAAEMERSYGRLVPIAPDRIEATSDGQVLRWQGRELRFLDAPGHARHHHVVWDDASRSWFTGDSFGLAYPELHTAQGAFILPTSTPVQFDPEALKRTIAAMLAAQPECMHLTHFGRVGDVARLAAQLIEQVDEMVGLALGLRTATDRHQRLKDGLQAQYRRRLQAHGVADLAQALELLALDVELNAQGVGIWLDNGA